MFCGLIRRSIDLIRDFQLAIEQSADPHAYREPLAGAVR